MSDELFVICAGGTGAKTAEALIHFCAAGLGPESVHVLLIDGDASNGNRKRAIATMDAYLGLQEWPWRARPQVDDNATSTELFASKVHLYSLAEKFADNDQGTLRPLIHGDAELFESLTVLLDEEEMDQNLQVGFSGKPNLGCLVMQDYLAHHFQHHIEASKFINALIDAASRNDEAAPKVIVVGSVFGGTGASLLPVAKTSIREVFKLPGKHGEPRVGNFDRLKWGKIMQLPYFRPESAEELDVVNPKRHSIDTSGALWYYGQGELSDEPIYLIGSCTPEKRTIPAVEGKDGQINPAFYHELLGALGIIHFYNNPDVEGETPIRHLGDARPGGGEGEDCSLANLPGTGAHSAEAVRESLSLLFQLASFAVFWRQQPKSEYRRGLLQYCKESTLTGWDDAVHHSLLEERFALGEEGSHCQKMLLYSARLLLWGFSALGSKKFHSVGIVMDEKTDRYLGLHNTLCEISGGEVNPRESDGSEGMMRNDHAVAKICRMVIAALIRERNSTPTRGLTHDQDIPRFELLQDGHAVHLSLGLNSLRASLVAHGFEEPKVDALIEAFLGRNWEDFLRDGL